MRRVPAILMVLFLVCPLFFAALVTIGVSTWAFDRGFYATLLSDERLYQIPDAVSSATWSGLNMPGLTAISARVSAKALREILTPAYMQSQAVNVSNQVFDLLQGRRETFDISFDLAPVKAALLGDPGKRFARALALDLPVGGTVADFTVRPGRLPLSRPSSLSVDKAAQIIQNGLPVFVQSIPDTTRLSDNPYYHGGPWPHFSVPGMLVFADVVLLLIAGGMGTAAAFVGGANRFEKLQWFGWPLLAPAAGVFLLGLAISLSFFSGWVQWGIESARLAAHGFDASFTAALVDAARRTLSRIGTGFLATGAIAAGAALGLLALSWAIPQSERKGDTA